MPPWRYAACASLARRPRPRPVEEILAPLPDDERELLATLAVAEKPIPWKTLADGLQWDGKPPSRLMDYGLLIELEQGMWLHEALRERLVREVGSVEAERRERID